MFDIALFDISPSHFYFLVGLSAVTSLMTASLGAGGGLILLAVMTQIFPAQLVLPMHGVVQLGSNANRAIMSWRHIQGRFLLWFLPGIVVGAALGQWVLVALPPGVLYISIGLFTLYICWGPKLPGLLLGRWGTVLLGSATTFLTLFVGATGPLVAGFVKQLPLGRFAVISTLSAAMSFQHIAKIAVFYSNGLDLVPFANLIIAMIIAGAIGTWLGLRFLGKMSDKNFDWIFKSILTCLAIRMIWQGGVALHSSVELMT